MGANLGAIAKSGQVGGALNDSRSRLAWMPLISIAAAAVAVEIPFFFRGTPSGHDVEFHMYSWLEVLSQWNQGIVYPRAPFPLLSSGIVDSGSDPQRDLSLDASRQHLHLDRSGGRGCVHVSDGAAVA